MPDANELVRLPQEHHLKCPGIYLNFHTTSQQQQQQQQQRQRQRQRQQQQQQQQGSVFLRPIT